MRNKDQPTIRPLYKRQSLGRGLAGLLEGRAERTSSLLLEEQDVESLKVAGSTSGLERSTLLGPRALSPLLSNALLVEELLDDASAGTAGEAVDNDGGQGQVPVGEGLALNTGRGTVNDSLLMDKDINRCVSQTGSCRVIRDPSHVRPDILAPPSFHLACVSLTSKVMGVPHEWP